ncbi:peroxidase family protein [Aquimarina pacifica]|uniref:peroxidase family protein n=1 Tax=Aquimarina pacifica TaxID=1296415 RepID=UPI00046ED996|nr:peroxidase family protein [Aquimarina pacifica]
MFKKLTLTTAAVLILASIPSSEIFAQQRSKTKIGNALLGTTSNKINAQKSSRNNRGSRDRNGRGSRRSEFRTIDGTNNNKRNEEWGAANIIFHRELPASYGSMDPNNALNNDNKPSPREISNLVCAEPVTQFNVRGLNTMLYFWGQFIDHDMTSTPSGQTEYAPIQLPEDEELFTEAIPFFRSEYVLIDSQREQLNNNTAFLDGSVVYGSDEERASWLRTFENGKLKTSENDYLPYNTVDGEITGAIDPNAPIMDDTDGINKVFVAGDHRASENTILTALQTVFLREHNRICDELIAKGYEDDEEIYQKARKEVGGIIQAITYEEFLPSLGVDLKRYRRYDERVRPDLVNTFSTASFRFGHTQVSDDVVVVDNECEEVGPGEFELVEAFFNPELFVEYGPEAFIKGATVHRLYKTDTKINEVLRDFLFGNIDDEIRFGIDLASLNIQRGRDHGLPDYNAARAYYTGEKAENFEDISSNDTVVGNLRSLYNDIDNIDLWVGILSEDQIEDGSFGKTMNAMLARQFENLRDGDFYYYKNDPYLSSSTKRKIENTSLSEVLQRNTTLTSLFDDAFELDICFGDGIPEDAIASKSNIKDNISIDLYPTVIYDDITVDITNSYTSGSIDVYSLGGIRIKHTQLDGSQQKVKENLENVPSGVYIIQVNTNENPTQVYKVVKN